MVKLIKRKQKVYTVNGDGIHISGTAREVAKIIGYTEEYVRKLAKAGKHFCLAGRDCSISFVDLEED